MMTCLWGIFDNHIFCASRPIIAQKLVLIRKLHIYQTDVWFTIDNRNCHPSSAVHGTVKIGAIWIMFCKTCGKLYSQGHIFSLSSTTPHSSTTAHNLFKRPHSQDATIHPPRLWFNLWHPLNIFLSCATHNHYIVTRFGIYSPPYKWSLARSFFALDWH